ncbi:MAG: aminotransferase, partial [Bacteroidetes bacterium HGW-Bacteroidetes-13]
MIKQADNLNKIQEYYFSQKLREVNKLIAEGKPIINLGIGSPDLLPPPAVIDALKNSLNDAGANKYQSYQGLPELREAMRKFYFDYYAVSVDASHEILPLMGSKEGIFHISKAFLNPGDEALIPNPGYPTYTSVTHLAGAIPVYYDLTEKNNWFPDLEALEKS